MIQASASMSIDSGGRVSDLVVARNCCMARMLPGEAELVGHLTCVSHDQPTGVASSERSSQYRARQLCQ